MSFGDSNNPYGQPQGQPQQPGYGYPQQAPQGVPPQQGYGYPAAPYGGGGYPGAAMVMPGGVKANRVILWILGVIQALFGLLAIVASSWLADQLASSPELDGQTQDVSSILAGTMIVVGVIGLAFGVWAIVMAAKIGSGGNGIRISGIVYGSLVTLGSIVNLLGANVFALISLVLGILLIVFFAKSDAAAWFKRNQQQY